VGGKLIQNERLCFVLCASLYNN